MKTLNRKIKSIGSARRKKGDTRVAGLIAEETILRKLRQARKHTQMRKFRPSVW